MKIPRNVRAFGRNYKIVRDNDYTSKMECWGYLDAMQDILALRKRSCEFTPGHEKQVFMHEIFHILDDNLHIKLAEEQIQLLAVGLITIIDDNKLDFSDGK